MFRFLTSAGVKQSVLLELWNFQTILPNTKFSIIPRCFPRSKKIFRIPAESTARLTFRASTVQKPQFTRLAFDSRIWKLFVAENVRDSQRNLAATRKMRLEIYHSPNSFQNLLNDCPRRIDKKRRPTHREERTKT